MTIHSHPLARDSFPKQLSNLGFYRRRFDWVARRIHACMLWSFIILFFFINNIPYRICSVAAPRQYFSHILANKGSPQRDHRVVQSYIFFRRLRKRQLLIASSWTLMKVPRQHQWLFRVWTNAWPGLVPHWSLTATGGPWKPTTSPLLTRLVSSCWCQIPGQDEQK